MKNFRKVIWIVTGFFLVGFSLLFGPDLLVKFQANQQASQFLKHAANQNFEEAFDQIYFYNGAYDEDVTISEENAKGIWVNRNKKLFTEGTYIKSYDDLSIRMNDGWPIGYVDLVMVENGQEKKYRDVYISFNKKNKWKVGMLQTMQEREWEKPYSGYVVQ
ncbi:hypothetical protein [Fictibacillus arsenicus]|uniref:DUF4829 domain-containing protein n=1 Tax=Fictibacillus arsenicus TaxID=255247 RepID=A0A1V3G8U5_9BACL|nr:hypothetical protein [Fictibacillus arsenicus]OOE12823.1 hypothetical protein UN64_12290 [Fictibacillus arsenicus]